jgi:FkbM family methyltransferase
MIDLEKMRHWWRTLRGAEDMRNRPVTQIPKAELMEYLPDNPVIVEAGAHLGVDTVELARQWPSGIVHAFEPVPALFKELELRTRRFANVRRWKQALSDRNGRHLLFISEGSSDGSSSLLEPEKHLEVHPDVIFERRIEVDTVTLDQWAAENAVPRIDFLWLDLQGMEPAVLQASPNVLGQIRALHAEVSLMPVYSGCILYPEFRRWMAAHGFRVVRELLPYSDMGNVLFVRES